MRLTNSRRVLASVVLSFRNEAENIPTLIARLDAACASADVDYELLFVNDSSTDGSVAILTREHQANPRVKIINMSRRFGVPECVRAGMAAAGGDVVIYMDADLQDPPELIPALLERWRDGADIVHTVRTDRQGENALKMFLTRVAYRAIRFGSSIDLPVDAGDFKLLSRRAVELLLQLPESDPYMRGLVVWLGLTQAFVPYAREARHAGRTHFPFFSKNPWKTFVLGMTSFSFTPIYGCLALALLGGVAAGILAVAGAVMFASGSPRATALGVIALLTFFWATTLAAIGIVGLYIIRIYKDVRSRPQYIVQSTVGLPPARDGASVAPGDLAADLSRAAERAVAEIRKS